MDTNELIIRESIRDTVARYNHAGDRGKYPEMVDCFHPEGEIHIVDGDTHRGRAALVSFFSNVAGNTSAASGLTLLRHCVTNTLIQVTSPESANADSYFQVLTNVGLDHWGRYRDVFTRDPNTERWLIQSRSVKTDAYAPNSAFNR